LGPDTVRNPDVAVIATEHLGRIDVMRSPVEGAPALAIEVVSPSHTAEDMRKRTRQYLAAGSLAVWIFYPTLRLMEIYSPAGMREIAAPACIDEGACLLFSGLHLSVPLADIFSSDPRV